MDSEKYTDEEILEMFSSLKTPFDDSTVEASKYKVLARISSEKGSRTWLRLAAAIVVLTALTAVLINLTKVQLEVSKSEKIAHLLPCGSSITLTDGELSYQPLFWSFRRTVSLDGQCYFDVQTGSPFSVESNMGTVNVKGTSFTVYADEEDMFVHCETGIVSVKNSKSIFELKRDEYCKIDEDVAFQEKAPASRTLEVLEASELNFINDPVSLVILKLEDWYDIEIRWEVQDNQFYSGRLKGNDLEKDLEVFSQTFNAKFNFDEARNVLIKY